MNKKTIAISCLLLFSFGSLFSMRRPTRGRYDALFNFLEATGRGIGHALEAGGRAVEGTARAINNEMEIHRKNKERRQKKIEEERIEIKYDIEKVEEAIKKLENGATDVTIPRLKDTKIHYRDEWGYQLVRYEKIQKTNDLNLAKKRRIELKEKLKRFEEIEEKNKKREEKFENIGDRVINRFEEDIVEGRKAQRNLREKMALAKQEGETRLKELKTKLDFIKNNPLLFIGIAVGSIALSYAAYKAIGIASNELEKYLGTPDLVDKTSYESLLRGWWNKLWGIDRKVKDIPLEDVIFEPPLKEKVKNIANDFKTAHLLGRNYSNILLHGPPGTGKTMLCKAMASLLDKPYFITSGSNLLQYQPEVGIQQFKALCRLAKSVGGIVIIDEAEVALCDRRKVSIKESRIVNAALNEISSTISKDVIFIFLTNKPDDLDPAIKDRVGVTLHIPRPGESELVQLMELYTRKANEDLGIEFEEGIEQYYPEIASLAANSGLVGRSIENIFLYKIPGKVDRTEDLVATPDLVEEAVVDFIQEKKHNSDDHLDKETGTNFQISR